MHDSESEDNDFDAMRKELEAAEQLISERLPPEAYARYRLEKQLLALEAQAHHENARYQAGRMRQFLETAAIIVLLVVAAPVFMRSFEATFDIPGGWATFLSTALLGVTGLMPILSRYFKMRAGQWERRAQAIEVELTIRHLLEGLVDDADQAEDGAKRDHDDQAEP